MAGLLLLPSLGAGQQVKTKPGAWLALPQMDAHAVTDPLAVFQKWRRESHVTIPVTPAVWQAHQAWQKSHPQAGVRRRALRLRRAAAAPRALADVVSAGNVVPAGGVSNYQGEVAVAIDPANPQWMAAATNTWLQDPQCGGDATQTLFGSQDGGQTWSYSCAPLPATLAGTSKRYDGSDPSLAWDSNGNVYASYMLLEADVYQGTATQDSMIVVAKSSDGGLTWNTPTPIVNDFGRPQDFDDKDMIAIDRSSGGTASHPNRIYAIWDTNNTQTVAWSDDGVSWHSGVVEAAAYDGMDIGGDLAVGPDGSVYAIWTRIAGEPGGPEGGDIVVFAKSIDGGQAWSTPVPIAGGQLSLNSFNTLIPAQDQRGINTFAAIAADDSSSPYAGSIYVVYADTPPGQNPGGAINVYMVKSADGGATWSPPLQVNDDQGDGAAHFFPWCSVDPSTGLLAVAWYDTRNDPGYQIHTQIFYAQSSDGGASFAPNLQISQASPQLANDGTDYSDENSLENQFYNPNQYGDYLMLSAAAGKVLLGWTDARQFFPQNETDPLAEDVVTDVLQVSAPSTYTITGEVNDATGQGVAGVQITGGGAHAVTGADGRYTLAGLAAGAYTVTAAAPGYGFNPASTSVRVQNAPVGGINFTATASVTVAAIAGSVTLDGQGVAGAVVSDGEATAITNAQGQYVFNGLVPGTYTLTASDAQYSLSPAAVTVALSGADVSAINFTVPTYSITGTVVGSWAWGGNGECCVALGGIAGVAVQAGGQSAVSDANGRYAIHGLPAGYYYVTSTLPGYLVQMFQSDELVSESYPWVQVTDADLDEIDFSAQPWGLYEIAGSITVDGAGLSGVKIASADTVAYTDAHGDYKIFEAKAGTYTLTPSKPGFSFQPGNQVVDIPATTAVGASFAVAAMAATAAQTVYTLSGQVTAAGSGLAKVSVAAGPMSAITGADGTYSISGVLAGAYTLDAAASGYSFAPATQAAAIAGASLDQLDFTASAQQVRISGTVQTPSGPLAGATLICRPNGSLLQYSATTNAQGNYQFQFPPAPDADGYIVELSDPGYLTQPSWATLPVTELNMTGVDFEAAPAYTISGRITDAQGNGAAHAGIGTFPAYNSNTPARFETDAQGDYSLPLPAGVYTLRPYYPVPPEAVDVFTPDSARVDLRTGDVTGINFRAGGFTISGQILRGAVGVAGATATLISEPVTGAAGGFWETTTSDAHGDFYFTNVPENNYLVEANLPGSGLSPPAIYQQVQKNIVGLTFNAVPGGTLSGTITDPQGHGEGGILVQMRSGTLTNWAAVTDASGNYSADLPNGSYTVAPCCYQFAFSPAQTAVTIQGQPVSGVDFTAAPLTSTLTLAQSQYQLNDGTDALQDNFTLTTNASGTINLNCSAPVPCSVTPTTVQGPAGVSGVVTISGLKASALTALTATVSLQGGGVSSSSTITIQRQNVVLTSGTASDTVTAGQIASFNLMVASANGYSGPVAMSCQSSNGDSCSVNPGAFDLTGNAGAQAVTVSVQTSSAAGLAPAWEWPGLLGLVGAGLLVATARRQRSYRRPRVLASTGLALVLLAASACGGAGGGSSPPPATTPPAQPRTSTVVVRSSAGTLEQTFTLTLTVNPAD